MTRSAARRLRSRHDTLYRAAGHIPRQRADILITPRVLQPVDIMGLERPEIDRVVGVIVRDALGIRVGENVVVFAGVHRLSGGDFVHVPGATAIEIAACFSLGDVFDQKRLTFPSEVKLDLQLSSR